MPKRPFRIGRSRTGLGLFATRPIRKGARIAEYKGPLLKTKAAEILESRGNRYLYELNSRWTIDGSNRRNVARYINHSCRPNAETDVKKGKVIVTAKKRIQPGDEITYNYGRDYFDVFIKPHGCRCMACKTKTSRVRSKVKK
jgi:hypothetical protein